MRLSPFLFILFMVPALANAALDPAEARKQFQALDWQQGPKTDDIAAKASLKTSENIVFLDEANTKKFLALTGNIPSDGNFLVRSKKDGWWAVFSFNPMGYVKDDEKIDADKLLQQLQDSDTAANEERKRLGIGELHTDGWYVPPHYDAASKHLEWGLKLHSAEGVDLNYTIRFLGRTGVMSATLVSRPETLDADVRSFKSELANFDFNSGERYAEFREGDHVAEIGLGALIAGGAIAVATKKGFWTVLVGFFAAAWKFIAVAFVGLMAKIRSLFSKNKS